MVEEFPCDMIRKRLEINVVSRYIPNKKLSNLMVVKSIFQSFHARFYRYSGFVHLDEGIKSESNYNFMPVDKNPLEQ